MSKCTVVVTVDGWQADGDVPPTYQEGQRITGTVQVWVTEAVRCDGLDVKLELTRTKSGYSPPSGPPPVRLFAGHWQPGEYAYRFELPSTFPPTYEGHLVGWAWTVLAVVDVPWAQAPKGQAPFVLTPAPWSGRLLVQPPAADGVKAGANTEGYEQFLNVVTLFILAVLVLGAGGVLELLGVAAGVRGPMIWLGAAGSLLLGVASLVAWWVQRKAGTRFRASVELVPQGRDTSDSSADRPPAAVRCAVRTRARGAIERVTAELMVREHVAWQVWDMQQQTTDYDYEQVLSRVEVPLPGDSSRGVFEGCLPLPELGTEFPPYTLFDKHGRGLMWQVNVRCYRKGSAIPDVESRYLTVRPEPAR